MEGNHAIRGKEAQEPGCTRLKPASGFPFRSEI
jgi:hypothetical protein